MVHGVCAFAVPLLYLFAPSMYHRCAPDTAKLYPLYPCVPLCWVTDGVQLSLRWGATQFNPEARASCACLHLQCTPARRVPHRHTGSTLMSQGDGTAATQRSAERLKPAETNTNVRAGRRDHGFLSRVQLCVVCVDGAGSAALWVLQVQNLDVSDRCTFNIALHTAPKIPFTCAA